MTGKSENKQSLTSIGIDRQTNKVIDKLCKRYSLKKGEIVKLAFQYMDKACINPAEAPESVKAELSRINKRQDDIIRFIKHYEEEILNPMVRTANSIAVRFDKVVKTISEKVDAEIANSKDVLKNALGKLDEQFQKQEDLITKHSKAINNLCQVQQSDNKKLLKLISLYSELAACGVMDGKRKENLRNEIIDLINEK